MQNTLTKKRGMDVYGATETTDIKQWKWSVGKQE